MSAPKDELLDVRPSTSEATVAPTAPTVKELMEDKGLPRLLLTRGLRPL